MPTPTHGRTAMLPKPPKSMKRPCGENFIVLNAPVPNLQLKPVYSSRVQTILGSIRKERSAVAIVQRCHWRRAPDYRNTAGHERLKSVEDECSKLTMKLHPA
jgi:hypothetical protein